MTPAAPATGSRLACAAVAALILTTGFALAERALSHAVAEGDEGCIQEISGSNLLSFVYRGAKNMVTGFCCSCLTPSSSSNG